MAVVMDHPVDDENAPIVRGRPDLAQGYGHGITYAKHFPPYVFSIRGVSCLVHRVAYVELHWYRVDSGGHNLVKLKRPVMIAQTCCAASFRLDPRISRSCWLPSADALPCGRCNGDKATFPRSAGGKARTNGLSRQEAHIKLGCVVKGY